MKTYYLTHECECGKELSIKFSDMTEGKAIKIDVAFICSQLEWKCDDCGGTYITGDIEIINTEDLGL